MDSSAASLQAGLAGRYRIERAIGSGGMATVYLADDLRHHRKVAVKVLRPELVAIVGGDRFLKEIEVTANLQHPHILGLIDSGEAGGQLYYVMPFSCRANPSVRGWTGSDSCRWPRRFRSPRRWPVPSTTPTGTG